MDKLREVTSDHLHAWSEQSSAALDLPKLVRRLLQATAQGRVEVDMPADGGVRTKGWDGIVSADGETESGHRKRRRKRQTCRGIINAEVESAFCPAGQSFWELTVQGRKAKFDEDYEKRSREVPHAGDFTYVAVSARRFPGKRDWVEDKRARGLWRDVRLYDAEDLAYWLERAPLVAAWFAQAVLGRPLSDVTDAETFLNRWRKRTEPPLPWALVLTDREQESQALLRWLDRGKRGVLHLSAHRREEAVLFVAATFAQSRQHTSWLPRTGIVETRVAWQWLMHQAYDEPLLLLPRFDDFDTGEINDRTGPVVIPLGGDAPQRAHFIRLPPIAWRSLARVLSEHGAERGQASLLARESDGNLAVLQRLCGYEERPAWIDSMPSAERMALLLVDAWSPKNPFDRQVIKALGADPEALERACTVLANREDTPVKYSPPFWRWVARTDVWPYLERELLVNESLLDRLEEVMLDVLVRSNPRQCISQEESIVAAVRGEIQEHSSLLRAGLVTSLLYISKSQSVLSGVTAGHLRARRVVRRLLEPAWQRWANFGTDLEYLALAAPAAFLSAAESSFNQGEAGISASPDLGGLFRALGQLAWDSDHLARVVHLLADLASQEDENRIQELEIRRGPIEGLFRILHPWSPQSRATGKQRIELLHAVFARRPAVGWRLGLAFLHDYSSLIFTSLPGEEGWASPLPSGTVLNPASDETLEQMKAVIDELARLADTDCEQWKQILELSICLVVDAEQIAPTLIHHALSRFDEVHSGMWDPEGRLWAVLCKRKQWLETRADDLPEILSRLGDLVVHFEPRDPAVRAARLLETDPDLWQWRSANEQIMERLKAIFHDLAAMPERWRLMERIAALLDEHIRTCLGALLVGLSYADELDDPMRAALHTSPMDTVALSFLAERAKHQDLAWCEHVLCELLDEDRADDATRLSILWPQSTELWNMLDHLDPMLAGAYWQRVSRVSDELPAATREQAIERMLAAGNIAGALGAASSKRNAVTATTVVRVLESWSRVPSAHTEIPFGREILMHLFERLDEVLHLDEAVASQLELAGFVHLRREPCRLFTALLSKPDLFAALVRYIYLHEGGELEQPTEAERNLAANARAALAAWRDVPGQDLPKEQGEQRLYDWAIQALEQTCLDGRRTGGLYEVARVLARAPADPVDGLWPNLAVRRLLDEKCVQGLAQHLRAARLERWRMWAPHQGGSDERMRAEAYHRDYLLIQNRWPRTAAMLCDLAHDCERSSEYAEQLARRMGYAPAKMASVFHEPPETDVASGSPPSLSTQGD